VQAAGVRGRQWRDGGGRGRATRASMRQGTGGRCRHVAPQPQCRVLKWFELVNQFKHVQIYSNNFKLDLIQKGLCQDQKN
jgi:hypothetical protein